MYIHDFDSAVTAIMLLGFLIGIILVMREELHMKGMTIFTVISLVILANYITHTYGLNQKSKNPQEHS